MNDFSLAVYMVLAIFLIYTANIFRFLLHFCVLIWSTCAEYTTDAEAPLRASLDGIEYSAHERPSCFGCIVVEMSGRKTWSKFS